MSCSIAEEVRRFVHAQNTNGQARMLQLECADIAASQWTRKWRGVYLQDTAILTARLRHGFIQKTEGFRHLGQHPFSPVAVRSMRRACRRNNGSPTCSSRIFT